MVNVQFSLPSKRGIGTGVEAYPNFALSCVAWAVGASILGQ